MSNHSTETTTHIDGFCPCGRYHDETTDVHPSHRTTAAIASAWDHLAAVQQAAADARWAKSFPGLTAEVSA